MPARSPTCSRTSSRRTTLKRPRPRSSTGSTSPCSIWPPSSTSKPCSRSSRSTDSPAASCIGEENSSTRRRSGARSCSPSRASTTTSAASARPRRRRTSARKIPVARRSHHLQPGVGHYGVFSGRRWRRDVYPVVRNAILTRRTSAAPSGEAARATAADARARVGRPHLGKAVRHRARSLMSRLAGAAARHPSTNRRGSPAKQLPCRCP